MTSYRDLVGQARAQIEEMTPEDLEPKLAEVILIDVRETGEHEQGAISSARLLPRGVLERDITGVAPDRSRPDRPLLRQRRALGAGRGELAGDGLRDGLLTRRWLRPLEV